MAPTGRDHPLVVLKVVLNSCGSNVAESPKHHPIQSVIVIQELDVITYKTFHTFPG